MHHRIVFCLGLAVAGVIDTPQSQAQSGPAVPNAGTAAQGGLAPGQVLAIVRNSGLTPLTQPARRGSIYLVLASDNMGGQLRVTIGAFDGRIINAAPAFDPRFAHQPPVRPRADIPLPPRTAVAPSSAPPPSGLREAPPRIARPVPPAPTSAAPATLDTPTRPPAAPVPRPKPAVAANANEAVASPVAAPAAPAAAPAPPPPSVAPKPPVETQMVPVAPLD